MKLVTCSVCGREIRPSNLARHVRARHLPKPVERAGWTQWLTPEEPIPGGWTHDHRYDVHIPRGEGPDRFRIYRLRASQLDVVGTTRHSRWIGLALIQLYEEGEIGQVDDAVGIMDTVFDPGRWLISPFTLGRRKEAR